MLKYRIAGKEKHLAIGVSPHLKRNNLIPHNRKKNSDFEDKHDSKNYLQQCPVKNNVTQKTPTATILCVLSLCIFLTSPQANSQNFAYANDKHFKESIQKNFPVGSDTKRLIKHLIEIGMIQKKDKIYMAKLSRGIAEGVSFKQPMSEEEVLKYYNKNLYRFRFIGRYIFWKIEATITFFTNKKDGTIQKYHSISHHHYRGL